MDMSEQMGMIEDMREQAYALEERACLNCGETWQAGRAAEAWPCRRDGQPETCLHCGVSGRVVNPFLHDRLCESMTLSLEEVGGDVVDPDSEDIEGEYADELVDWQPEYETDDW